MSSGITLNMPEVSLLYFHTFSLQKNPHQNWWWFIYELYFYTRSLPLLCPFSHSNNNI